MPNGPNVLLSEMVAPITNPTGSGVAQNRYAISSAYYGARATQKPVQDLNLYNQSGLLLRKNNTLDTMIDNAFLTTASYMPTEPIIWGALESPVVGSVDVSMLDGTVAGPSMMPRERPGIFTGQSSNLANTNQVGLAPASLGMGATNMTPSNMVLTGYHRTAVRPGTVKNTHNQLAFNSRCSNLELFRQARERHRHAQAGQAIMLPE